MTGPAPEFDAIEDAPMIETPVDAVINAQTVFIFAMHVRQAILEHRIIPSTFVDSLKIDTGGDGIEILKKYGVEELDIVSLNLVYNALGTSAMAVDTALKTLGPRNPTDTSELGSLRNIFYMLRCAFAHDPFAPRWLCDERYQRTYAVPSAGVTFDGLARNGEVVMPEHIGGLEGYFKLLTQARTVLGPATQEATE